MSHALIYSWKPMSCGSECLTEPQVPSSSTEYHSRTWETSITGLAGRNVPGSWRKSSVLSQLHFPHVFCTPRTPFHLHSFLFLLHKRKATQLIVPSLLAHRIVQRIITQVSFLQFGPFTDVISVARIGFVINTFYILAALHSF